MKIWEHGLIIRLKVLIRQANGQHLNFVSTTAHTVWGVLCGKLLMSDKPPAKKIQIMLIAGVSALIIGYSLDLLNITPIIKKIATSSFVFASGGWTILALCFSYWLIDVKKLFSNGSKFYNSWDEQHFYLSVFSNRRSRFDK